MAAGSAFSIRTIGGGERLSLFSGTQEPSGNDPRLTCRHRVLAERNTGRAVAAKQERPRRLHAAVLSLAEVVEDEAGEFFFVVADRIGCCAVRQRDGFVEGHGLSFHSVPRVAIAATLHPLRGASCRFPGCRRGGGLRRGCQRLEPHRCAGAIVCGHRAFNNESRLLFGVEHVEFLDTARVTGPVVLGLALQESLVPLLSEPIAMLE